MLSHEDQLTEMVRRLEAQSHVFARDPLLITEKMVDEPAHLPARTFSVSPVKAKDAATAQRLYERARRIDADGRISKLLTTIDGRIKGVVTIVSVVWCVLGFMGLFALLQSDVVNFFYVLVSLLGMHTVMLLLWLVLTLVPRRHSTGTGLLASLVNPRHLIRGDDDVTKTAVTLYQEQLDHAGMRWYVSMFGHQLWLATLVGMLCAIIFLLIVRQYSFSWESTLLSDDTLVLLTSVLGWLPSLVGFSVPDADAVIASRHIVGDMSLSMARSWAGLLVGSLLMYGILPRALAWTLCWWQFHRVKMRLDLTLPYYQKILQFWQRSVVDADDFRADNKRSPASINGQNPLRSDASHTSRTNAKQITAQNHITAQKTAPLPSATLSAGHKIAVLLEYPITQMDKPWYINLLEQQLNLSKVNTSKNVSHHITDFSITDFGILDDRDQLDKLLAILQDTPAQVIVGIHPKTLPDRGVMRRLTQIANHASAGVLVHLLPAHLSDGSNTAVTQQTLALRHDQWQAALAQHGLALI